MLILRHHSAQESNSGFFGCEANVHHGECRGKQCEPYSLISFLESE